MKVICLEKLSACRSWDHISQLDYTLSLNWPSTSVLPVYLLIISSSKRTPHNGHSNCITFNSCEWKDASCESEHERSATSRCFGQQWKRNRHIRIALLLKFRFSYHGVKITRDQFPFHFAFAGTEHRGKGYTLDRLVVEIRSKLSPVDKCTLLSRKRKHPLICFCCTKKVTI